MLCVGKLGEVPFEVRIAVGLPRAAEYGVIIRGERRIWIFLIIGRRSCCEFAHYRRHLVGGSPWNVQDCSFCRAKHVGTTF